MKIKDIASVSFGPYEKGMRSGGIKYLLASHFDDNFQLTKFKTSYIEKNEKNDTLLLEPNDIILSGKGHRIFAWAYDTKFGPTVPSSLFYIIRTDPKIILGEYLAIYLNSDKLQFALKNIGVGSQITSIPKRELQQINVMIPSLKEQRRIVEVTNLMNKDYNLTKQLLGLKKTLKRGILTNMINELSKK